MVLVEGGNYTAKHTGKSGFISEQPRGARPIPFSFIEEISSNLYPSSRKYIPLSIRDFTDSYYDLRNKQYKYWYDKWGKPHINKWWKNTLDETLRIKKAYEAQNNGKYSDSRSKFNVRYSSRVYKRCNCHSKPFNLRCRKCLLKHRGLRQGPYGKRRSSFRKTKHISYFTKYSRRWRF